MQGLKDGDPIAMPCKVCRCCEPCRPRAYYRHLMIVWSLGLRFLFQSIFGRIVCRESLERAYLYRLPLFSEDACPLALVFLWTYPPAYSRQHTMFPYDIDCG